MGAVAGNTRAASGADAGTTSTAAAGRCVIGNEGCTHQRGGRETYHHMAKHGISFPVTA
jgi:hypothetical protein